MCVTPPLNVGNNALLGKGSLVIGVRRVEVRSATQDPARIGTEVLTRFVDVVNRALPMVAHADARTQPPMAQRLV